MEKQAKSIVKKAILVVWGLVIFWAVGGLFFGLLRSVERGAEADIQSYYVSEFENFARQVEVGGASLVPLADRGDELPGWALYYKTEQVGELITNNEGGVDNVVVDKIAAAMDSIQDTWVHGLGKAAGFDPDDPLVARTERWNRLFGKEEKKQETADLTRFWPHNNLVHAAHRDIPQLLKDMPLDDKKSFNDAVLQALKAVEAEKITDLVVLNTDLPPDAIRKARTFNVIVSVYDQMFAQSYDELVQKAVGEDVSKKEADNEG